MYSQPVVLNAAKNAPQKPSPAGILRKRLIVLGIERIELAKMIIDEWLGAEFEGGRHQTRVDMIMAIENKDN